MSEESRELGDIGCFFDRDRKMMCHLQAGYDGENGPLNNPEPGNGCPRCPTGTLKVQRCVELGHTFHLGTRYSAPLKALVEVPTQGGSPTSTTATTSSPAATTAPPTPSAHRIPVSMGCHGLGISRLIGALASVLSTPLRPSLATRPRPLRNRHRPFQPQPPFRSRRTARRPLHLRVQLRRKEVGELGRGVG